MLDIELIMSEFGTRRRNCGGADLAENGRLDPTLGGFRRVFPNATVTLYTDYDCDVEGDIRIIKVRPVFDSEHERYGWRAHDYYQIFGLLN